MEINIARHNVECFLQEVAALNQKFSSLDKSGTTQPAVLKAEFIKSYRTKDDYSPIVIVYDLILEVPESQYTFVAFLKDGLVTVNEEYKEKFDQFGDQLTWKNFYCKRCGKTLYRKVFICQDSNGEYLFFGGSCIDIVCPNYKLLSNIYKEFSVFRKKFNSGSSIDCLPGYYSKPWRWFYDTELVFRYLYPKFKYNPRFKTQEDTNLFDSDYFLNNKLDPYTDEIKQAYSNMIEYYRQAEIPTDNDFKFNTYTVAKRCFEDVKSTGAYIDTNFCKWVVTLYLQQVFKPLFEKVENPYKLGDTVTKLPVKIISLEKDEECWGYRSELKTIFIFETPSGIRFTIKTSKHYPDLVVGANVVISGKITYQSNGIVPYNRISRCKIEELEELENEESEIIEEL